MGRMLGLSDNIIKELLVVDVQMCVLGALAIICFLVAASTLKWMGRDYLREAIQRDGWIVTVAGILLTLPIIALGFVGLVIVMWTYGIPFYVALK